MWKYVATCGSYEVFLVFPDGRGKRMHVNLDCPFRNWAVDELLELLRKNFTGSKVVSGKTGGVELAFPQPALGSVTYYSIWRDARDTEMEQRPGGAWPEMGRWMLVRARSATVQCVTSWTQVTRSELVCQFWSLQVGSRRRASVVRRKSRLHVQHAGLSSGQSVRTLHTGTHSWLLLYLEVPRFTGREAHLTVNLAEVKVK